MLDNLKKLFAEKKEDQSTIGQRDADLASVALMILVSNADHEVDPLEVERIMSIARETCAVDSDDVQAFFNEAELRSEASVSLYEFTEVINACFDKAQKFALIKNLWRVAYADQTLDRYEDSTIRKVAELIYVSHTDFIKAKLSVQQSQLEP